ncbi:MAG: DUF3052 domain-containing protein, partial [Phycisphaerae bacterium]|nr:DUF3052 domain-containing protein [Phycisphaerae bacterium]
MSGTLPAPAGYSGKPLPEKLGYKPGMVAAFIALPAELAALADSVAFAEVVPFPAWKPKGRTRFDLIHAFTTSHAEVTAGLPLLQDALKRDGMIWVSWPKKAA